MFHVFHVLPWFTCLDLFHVFHLLNFLDSRCLPYFDVWRERRSGSFKSFQSGFGSSCAVFPSSFLSRSFTLGIGVAQTQLHDTKATPKLSGKVDPNPHLFVSVVLFVLFGWCCFLHLSFWVVLQFSSHLFLPSWCSSWGLGWPSFFLLLGVGLAFPKESHPRPQEERRSKGKPKTKREKKRQMNGT